ncbi:uncharacterized protein EDB93DRAFT_1096597, partial [Suillus bovinus]|uniref:uncharacterized protein n=1 Tax=Suillus bovinus TaxID=48563 RepID=UPI001B88606B
PYVHNCVVTLHEGRHIYQFCVFFKRHCRLRTNPLLSSIDHILRGDAVVMRIGASVGYVVTCKAGTIHLQTSSWIGKHNHWTVIPLLTKNPSVLYKLLDIILEQSFHVLSPL